MSHSSVRRNDGETSKYNNQQGIHNHWTCQCNAGGSFHLRGTAVAPAPGKAAIAPWRRLQFRNCLPLPILVSVHNSSSGVCLCRQAVAAWTTTWHSMATMRWTPDPAVVSTFWGYQRGAFILWSWKVFDRWASSNKKSHRQCRGEFHKQAYKGGYLSTIWSLSKKVWM